jgi:hypothetical protein
MLLRLLTTAAMVAAFTAPARAVPALDSLFFDFDSSVQGWTVEDGGALTHVASGGAPGGYLQFTDISSADMLAVLQAGGADWSAFLGGTLRFDARILSNHLPDWPGFGEVRLSGPGGSVLADVVPAGLPLPNGQWQRFSVPLTVAVFGDSLASVLANVSRLSIKTEYAISDPGLPSSFESLGLDNVAISAVPEAPTWALLLAGGLLLPALKRRRR